MQENVMVVAGNISCDDFFGGTVLLRADPSLLPAPPPPPPSQLEFLLPGFKPLPYHLL